MESVAYTDIPRCDPQLVAGLGRFSVADLYEAVRAAGGSAFLMDASIKPLNRGLRVFGQAVTAYCHPGDNLLMHQAMEFVGQGQMLVVSNGGFPTGALFGELASEVLRRNGVAGVVIDGPSRDSDALEKSRFPIWCRSFSVTHAQKKGPGSVNAPISCGGAPVNPGDVVCADGDGVIVIPLEQLRSTLALAESRIAVEEAMRQRIVAGETLYAISGKKKQIEAAGVKIVPGVWPGNQ